MIGVLLDDTPSLSFVVVSDLLSLQSAGSCISHTYTLVFCFLPMLQKLRAREDFFHHTPGINRLGTSFAYARYSAWILDRVKRRSSSIGIFTTKAAVQMAAA